MPQNAKMSKGEHLLPPRRRLHRLHTTTASTPPARPTPTASASLRLRPHAGSSPTCQPAGDLNTPEEGLQRYGRRSAAPPPSSSSSSFPSFPLAPRSSSPLLQSSAARARSSLVGKGSADTSFRWKKDKNGGGSGGGRGRWHGSAVWAAFVLPLLAGPCSAGNPNEIQSSLGLKNEPVFGEAIKNVTVAAGREATLSCIVDSLGDFKVGWLKVDSQTILSLQKRVVTHNTRISVTHDEHRTWNLHIKQVKESDRGCYMCQINTPVMKNGVGCIEVHVPPDIMNDATSSDTTVHEGERVQLRCEARGYPPPEILWKREDGKNIILKSSGRDGTRSLEAVSGENLTMENVSRKQMGAYLCIASNKVPPSVSKRIIVSVFFSPVVKVDNQLIGAPLETEVEIQCQVEAYPHAINYWAKDNGEILLNGTKYQVLEMVDLYRVTMKLAISNFTQNDAGQYKCVSTNSLGKADTSIRLYVIEVPTARTTTEHQSYVYPTTPHSKAVDTLDLLRRDGHQVLRPREGLGPGGVRVRPDGSVVGLGVVELSEKEQSRQRQRQRLELGEGRLENGGYLGGGAGYHPGQMEGGGGSGGASALPVPSATTLLLPLLFLLHSFLGLPRAPGATRREELTL